MILITSPEVWDPKKTACIFPLGKLIYNSLVNWTTTYYNLYIERIFQRFSGISPGSLRSVAPFFRTRTAAVQMAVVASQFCLLLPISSAILGRKNSIDTWLVDDHVSVCWSQDKCIWTYQMRGSVICNQISEYIYIYNIYIYNIEDTNKKGLWTVHYTRQIRVIPKPDLYKTNSLTHRGRQNMCRHAPPPRVFSASCWWEGPPNVDPHIWHALKY